jgi:hypothetical protein
LAFTGVNSSLAYPASLACTLGSGWVIPIIGIIHSLEPGLPRPLLRTRDGTNAVEAALKLARKVTGRYTVAYFQRGFHAARKLGHPAPADELYVGSYHRACRAAAITGTAGRQLTRSPPTATPSSSLV